MAGLRIGEVAERSGLAPSAIRYYESEGLLPKAPRRNGRRVYEEAIFDRLGLIDLAQRAGFRVAEIKKLLAGFSGRAAPGERWRSLAQAKLGEIEGRIAEAERMKRVLRTVLGCRCPTIDDCGRAMRDGRGRGRRGARGGSRRAGGN